MQGLWKKLTYSEIEIEGRVESGDRYAYFCPTFKAELAGISISFCSECLLKRYKLQRAASSLELFALFKLAFRVELDVLLGLVRAAVKPGISITTKQMGNDAFSIGTPPVQTEVKQGAMPLHADQAQITLITILPLAISKNSNSVLNYRTPNLPLNFSINSPSVLNYKIPNLPPAISINASSVLNYRIPNLPSTNPINSQ
ncbi:hypothetical protein VNO77_27184 [Canavalia gladiata]|uniref:Uncharacterized protein n=1 Tax=Canavalia gladiata TaxID=3824 RepID=A0AAN9KVB0_CANGL